MIAALVLTAALKLEIDLGGLINAHRLNRWRREALAHPERIRCGIRVVGYRWRLPNGTRIRYMGRTYDVRRDDTLELIAGREVPKGASTDLDQFGFADVEARK